MVSNHNVKAKGLGSLNWKQKLETLGTMCGDGVSREECADSGVGTVILPRVLARGCHKLTVIRPLWGPKSRTPQAKHRFLAPSLRSALTRTQCRRHCKLTDSRYEAR